MKRLLTATSKFLPLAITVSCIVVVLLLYISGLKFMDFLELKTYDLRLQYRGTLTPKSNIALCVIDEKSLRREGRWPWPRWKIAKLINILSDKGVKVIAFDIGFFEPDQYVNKGLLDLLESRIEKTSRTETDLALLLQKLRKQFDNDRILADSMRNSRARIVLGYFFHMTPGNVAFKIDHKELARRLSLIETSRYPIVFYKQHGSDLSPFTKAFAPVTNLGQLTEAAESTGYFNIFPDPDGVVRRIPLAIQCGGDVYSPLAVQAIWNALDRPPLSVIVSGYRIVGIKIGTTLVPTDANGNLLINYLGPPKTFPQYSITDILQGKISEAKLGGSIVFVGATAIGIYDQRATPLSPVYPGLEVHATVADNILTHRLVVRPKWSRAVDLLTIAILGLLAVLALWLLGPYWAAFICGGLFLAQAGVATGLFWSRGLWLNIVYPALSLAMVYSLLTVYYYVTQEREKKRLRAAFHHYVSPVVVRDLLKHREEIRLGGQKKDISVLFSDLRGFTKLSSEASPHQLVSQLNEYLTAMTDIVFSHKGTLDKYMGDGLMALFGAPVPLKDHPYRACDAALEMIDTLADLNKKWIRSGYAPLDVGIGISTGKVLVGNLGSRQRFDYTAIGEGVNLGARLEGLSNFYGINILISEATYEDVKDRFYCVEVDTIRLSHGRTTTIYWLVGKQRPSSERVEALDNFLSGLRYYRSKDWKHAADMFYSAYKSDPAFRAAEIYLRRCRYLMKNPPPSHWDGVWSNR